MRKIWMRVSATGISIAIILGFAGQYLQSKKADIVTGISGGRFDALMSCYYMGTGLKLLAAWIGLAALTLFLIAGIMCCIHRMRHGR